MMEEQRNRNAQYSQYNQITDPAFIKLKLDTAPLIGRIERFLRGTKSIIKKDDGGNYVQYEEEVCKPYANEEGIAAILAIIDTSANNHSVQGNLDKDELYNFLADTREEIAMTIVMNCYQWEIHETKLSMITDTILRFFRLFMSRTVNNLERESMMNQIQTREIISQNDKQSGIRSFAGGMNGART